MTGSADRLQRLIFLLTAGFLFTAVALRSALSFADDIFATQVLLLLLVWLVLLVMAAVSAHRWASLFPLYMITQTAIVVALLARTREGDFYAVLFAILSMQAAQRLGWKTALLWIALFAPLTALPLTRTYDVSQGIVFAAVYTGIDIILAFFTLTTRRATEARARNVALLDELHVANDEIETYSRQVERLAAARERHRLARELHDSVTQTVFSMNLTAQSAALLLRRDRGAVDAQLARLEDLGQTALAEILALGTELAAVELDESGLAHTLRRHITQRGLPDGLSVTLSVVDEEAPSAASAPREPGGLSATEELCLFRIAQEALNNIVKHAQADEATIRLRLSPPCRLEVEDHGRGFDLEEGQRAGGMGLGSMRERAAEIGWSFNVTSAPGAGTRIVVEQRSSREEASGQALAGARSGQALAGATSVQASQVEAAQSDGRVEGWPR